ncbi:hypothetical protein [Mycobacterium tuberculosis]|uniref:hypothetical protein n=1 Tax=Mycobacterium tuberculosis TaxID=1773 RepID=UPI003D7D8B69
MDWLHPDGNFPTRSAASVASRWVSRNLTDTVISGLLDPELRATIERWHNHAPGACNSMTRPRSWMTH